MIECGKFVETDEVMVETGLERQRERERERERSVESDVRNGTVALIRSGRRLQHTATRVCVCAYTYSIRSGRRSYVAVSCSVLQCVAVCCSVLQCVAVCCSVLQYIAVCCSVLI